MDDWKGAPLRQILWAEFIPDGQSERITFEGPQVDLPPKHALALTLTLHELATNAAKYGALSKNGGTLMVKWSVKMDGAERELSFEWNENLDEPLPSRRVTESFGMKLIKNAITHDLRGTCGHTLATGAATVTVVSTFEDAEKAIGDSNFDLALLDVNLNGRKSFPLADLLAKKNTPVVFGTGYNLMARQMEGFKAGGVCVTKPYSAASLQKGLITVLQQKGEQHPGAASAS